MLTGSDLNTRKDNALLLGHYSILAQAKKSQLSQEKLHIRTGTGSLRAWKAMASLLLEQPRIHLHCSYESWCSGLFLQGTMSPTEMLVFHQIFSC